MNAAMYGTSLVTNEASAIAEGRGEGKLLGSSQATCPAAHPEDQAHWKL